MASNENIILLEIIIDELILEHHAQKHIQEVRGEICASFQFLDNEPVPICEQDIKIKKNECDCSKDSLKHGKSCLFAITAKQTKAAISSFDILIELYKKCRPNVVPDKITIGKGVIPAAEMFKELMATAELGGTETPVKSFKSIYVLANKNDELIGRIRVFIRMSCFGKNIITDFQMNLDNDATEFKSKDAHYMFQYNQDENTCAGNVPCGACNTSPTCDISTIHKVKTEIPQQITCACEYQIPAHVMYSQPSYPPHDSDNPDCVPYYTSAIPFPPKPKKK